MSVCESLAPSQHNPVRPSGGEKARRAARFKDCNRDMKSRRGAGEKAATSFWWHKRPFGRNRDGTFSFFGCFGLQIGDL